MLNLTEGFESTLRHCLHYLVPALLASNSQLNKYGYERRFIEKSWWIRLEWRKLAVKYCNSEWLWCPIVKDVMKLFVLPEQACSLISLLMLLLLPGFVFGLLPPGNTQTAPGKAKAITSSIEMTARSIKTNLEVRSSSDSVLSFTIICKWRGTGNVIVHTVHDQSRWVTWGLGPQPGFHPASFHSVEQVFSLCSLCTGTAKLWAALQALRLKSCCSFEWMEVDFLTWLKHIHRSQGASLCYKVRMLLQNWPRDQIRLFAAVPNKSQCLTAVQGILVVSVGMYTNISMILQFIRYHN